MGRAENLSTEESPELSLEFWSQLLLTRCGNLGKPFSLWPPSPQLSNERTRLHGLSTSEFMESRKGRREMAEGMKQDGDMRKKDRQEKQDGNRKGKKGTDRPPSVKPAGGQAWCRALHVHDFL